MTTGITAGKRKGLEAVADSLGMIAALAVDQRGAMRSLFAKAMGVEPASVPVEMLVIRNMVSQPRSLERNPRACFWPTSKPATTSRWGGVCRDCWRGGRYNGLLKRVQTA